MSNKTLEQVLTDLGLIAKAEAKGRAEGEARAKTETRREVAQNLKRLGIPVNQIAEAVEMPLEEVLQV